MGNNGLGVSYWLPQTTFEVAVTRRSVVVTSKAGSRLDQVADVQLVRTTTADPTSRQTLQVEAGLLEKLALVINFDDRGFIESINTESGRDISPVVSLLSKAVSLASAVFLLGGGFVREDQEGAPSLEEQWADAHQKLASRASAFEDRINELLQSMSEADTPPKALVELGEALHVLESQLAAISRMKRSWIAAQAGVLDSESWTLAPAELLQLRDLDPEISGFEVPTSQQESAKRFGVIIAIVDSKLGQSSEASSASEVPPDVVVFRATRPATVAVYLRDGFGTWHLDKSSIRSMDVVDHVSDIHHLNIDGAWLRTRSFELAYHPDMSLKTFGVTSTPTAASIGTSIGEVFDAAAAARKQLAERPSEDAVAREAAQTQLDLLKAAGEYEVLAATREKAVELAILEQQKKLREAAE